MKSRGLLIFLGALFIGTLAAFYAYQWVQSRTSPGEGLAPVVVAAVEIPYGEKLDPKLVQIAKWPKDSIPPGAFKTVDEVQDLVATQKIYPNEPLLPGRAAKHLPGSVLASTIAPNMRAVSVRVNDVAGVGGFLAPGNRVDVIHTSRAKNGNNNEQMSELLEENLKVLAVDQVASPDQEKPAVARSVTLEVTPEQAEHIVQAAAEGALQLVLRNPLDKSSSLAALAAKKKPPVPEEAPPPVASPMPVPVPVVARPPTPQTIPISVLVGNDVFTIKFEDNGSHR
jgi:pilus assembly protein CpaB